MDLADLFHETDADLRALLDDPDRAAEWLDRIHQRIAATMGQLETAQARVPAVFEEISAGISAHPAVPKLIFTVPIRVDTA